MFGVRLFFVSFFSHSCMTLRPCLGSFWPIFALPLPPAGLVVINVVDKRRVEKLEEDGGGEPGDGRECCRRVFGALVDVEMEGSQESSIGEVQES